MNIKLAIRVSVFTILSVAISKAHACCQEPVASFSWQSPVYCGDEVTFTCTSTDADSAISSRSWTASGGTPSTGSGSTFTTKWCSTGPETVTLEVWDSDSSEGCPPDKSDDCDQEVTVLAVQITSVTSDVDEECVDCNITFEVTTSPADKYGCIDWSAPGGDPSTGSGETFITKWGTSGTKTVTATGCSNFMDKQVTIYGWEANPAISGEAIKKSHDQVWFHISQSCDLKAKGYDADTKCGTEYDDYIRLDLTEWSGSPDLSSTSGETVTWDPDYPTSMSGVTITATIKDDPSSPDGIDTDDADAPASRVLKAYEAAADLVVNWANSGGSGNDTTTLFETTGPYSDSISANMNDSESVSVDASTLPAGTTDTDSGLFQPQEPFVKGKWMLRLNPSDAPLDPPGQIKVTTDVDVSGTLECTVDDDDGPAGCPVSISVSAGYGPVSVSITPELDVSGENCEAQAAISWGYSSDLGVSRADPYSERLEKSSGDGTGTFQEPFNFTPDSQDHIGVKDDIANGLTKVGGKIECKGWHEVIQPPPNPFPLPPVHLYWDSSCSMACTGSTVTYYIDFPTVQNPAYWTAEDGY